MIRIETFAILTALTTLSISCMAIEEKVPPPKSAQEVLDDANATKTAAIKHYMAKKELQEQAWSTYQADKSAVNKAAYDAATKEANLLPLIKASRAQEEAGKQLMKLTGNDPIDQKFLGETLMSLHFQEVPLSILMGTYKEVTDKEVDLGKWSDKRVTLKAERLTKKQMAQLVEKTIHDLGLKIRENADGTFVLHPVDQ